MLVCTDILTLNVPIFNFFFTGGGGGSSRPPPRFFFDNFEKNKLETPNFA